MAFWFLGVAACARALHTHSDDILSSPAAPCRTTSTLCAALRLLWSMYASEPKGAGPGPVKGAPK